MMHSSPSHPHSLLQLGQGLWWGSSGSIPVLEHGKKAPKKKNQAKNPFGHKMNWVHCCSAVPVQGRWRGGESHSRQSVSTLPFAQLPLTTSRNRGCHGRGGGVHWGSSSPAPPASMWWQLQFMHHFFPLKQDRPFHIWPHTIHKSFHHATSCIQFKSHSKITMWNGAPPHKTVRYKTY